MSPVGFFIEHAFNDPVFYFSVVFGVMVSIILHELGHGFAALWQGDDTPRAMGHITLDPMVHMGPVSLACLFFVGISWGLMPVNPSRFRSRYGRALVAFAGPAVNLVLAALGTIALGLSIRFGAGPNLFQFCMVFAAMNIVLFVFNLLPLPPLDGATVLGDLSPPFGRFAANPDNQPWFLGGFILMFIVGFNHLYPIAYEWVLRGALLFVG